MINIIIILWYYIFHSHNFQNLHEIRFIHLIIINKRNNDSMRLYISIWNSCQNLWIRIQIWIPFISLWKFLIDSGFDWNIPICYEFELFWIILLYFILKYFLFIYIYKFSINKFLYLNIHILYYISCYSI
jgi:hypothetical protein